MHACIGLGGDLLLGVAGLAAVSAIVMTVLILAALLHPIAALLAMMLISGAIAK